MLTMTLRFPLGVYHAQAQADFARAEWPPHPVRLIAALVAAAHAGTSGSEPATLQVIDRLAGAGAPVIVAPRGTATEVERGEDEPVVRELRGASRWAPRNHELSELTAKGIAPRDLGRGRAEVHKVGVAVGELPVAFSWPELTLAPAELERLRAVASDVTFVGTSRSPVVVTVATDADAEAPAWRPSERGTTVVRISDARTLEQLDRWHGRRSAPLSRSGAPSRAPLVVAPRIGSAAPYRHDLDPAPVEPFDPETWGDMLVLRIAPEIRPMARTTFAVARATRKALLDTYGPVGTDDEAPPILRGRGNDAHAAVLPLSFVAGAADGTAGERADGSVQGVAIVLPHAARVHDLATQRERVVRGLSRLITDQVGIRVPGVGVIRVAPVPVERTPWSLQEGRYRVAADRWTTATPLVHSRYRTAKSSAALLAQVASECADVGLPAPREVQVRRGARLRGAPDRVDVEALPASWTGPVKGPQAHLDLWFDRPVAGPVLLGRARHFGLGVCLPFEESAA